MVKGLLDIDLTKLNGEQLLDVVTFMDNTLKEINKDKDLHFMPYNPGMDDQIKTGMGV